MANKTLTRQQLVGLVRKRLNGGRTLQDVADEFALTVSAVRRLRDSSDSKPAKASATSTNGSKPKTQPAKATGDIAVIKADELHRLLSDVLPFAGTDDTLPMLRCVRIESDGKRLLAATTDRFTMGVSKVDFEATDNEHRNADGKFEYRNLECEFLLGPTDVSTLIKIAKTVKRDIDWRLVTISKVGEIPPGCTVPTFTYRFAFFSGEQVTVKPFDAEFPKFKQLIPSGGAVARAATGFTMPYLAKFAKVANDHGGLVRVFSHDDTPHGKKPISVLIGDSFVGLIMPQALADHLQTWSKPGWL
jgi:hypothetical protein